MPGNALNGLNQGVGILRSHVSTYKNSELDLYDSTMTYFVLYISQMQRSEAWEVKTYTTIPKTSQRLERRFLNAQTWRVGGLNFAEFILKNTAR